METVQANTVFNFAIHSYLPLPEELYLSNVHLQAFCFSFADGGILSGQRLR